MSAIIQPPGGRAVTTPTGRPSRALVYAAAAVGLIASAFFVLLVVVLAISHPLALITLVGAAAACGAIPAIYGHIRSTRPRTRPDQSGRPESDGTTG